MGGTQCTDCELLLNMVGPEEELTLCDNHCLLSELHQK